MSRSAITGYCIEWYYQRKRTQVSASSSFGINALDGEVRKKIFCNLLDKSVQYNTILNVDGKENRKELLSRKAWISKWQKFTIIEK